MNDQASIGGRLRRLLDTRGESLKAFAERAGIPYRSLQNTLSGDRRPNSDQLAKIATAGVDVNYLLTGLPSATKRFIDSIGPLPEGDYSFAADREVIEAVARFVQSTTDTITDRAAAEGTPLRYSEAAVVFRNVADIVLKTLVQSERTLASARKAGLPIDSILQSIFGLALETLYVTSMERLAKRPAAGEGPAPGPPPPPGDAAAEPPKPRRRRSPPS